MFLLLFSKSDSSYVAETKEQYTIIDVISKYLTRDITSVLLNATGTHLSSFFFFHKGHYAGQGFRNLLQAQVLK